MGLFVVVDWETAVAAEVEEEEEEDDDDVNGLDCCCCEEDDDDCNEMGRSDCGSTMIEDEEVDVDADVGFFNGCLS